MSSFNPVADMIVELMQRGNARGLPMERSPELGQYLRESYGFQLPSEAARRPESQNILPFPEQNLGTGGVRFDAEGWPTGSGGWAQRSETDRAADAGARSAGIQENLTRLGLQPGLMPSEYRTVLSTLPDQVLREMGARMGYSGVDNISVLRTQMATDFSLHGRP